MLTDPSPCPFACTVAERVGRVDIPAKVDDAEQQDQEEWQDERELDEGLPSGRGSGALHGVVTRVTVIVEVDANAVEGRSRFWV